MEQQEYTTTPTPPAATPTLPAVTAEHPSPANQPVSWKQIMICMAVSVASAVISSYLTIARVSPHLLSQDSSQSAEESETLRNDWRRQYEQSIEQRAALEAKVEKLNAQVDKLTKTIKQTETQLATIQTNLTTYKAVKESLDHATKTDDGLRKEAGRIIGDLGVSSIRIRK